MKAIEILAGEWIGHYPGHHDEVIRIVQSGLRVEAVKVTGDDFVPAGEVTWRADLQTMQGEGQIAEEGFRNPRFVPGQLVIHGFGRIEFTWTGLGSVEFRRDS